MRLDTIVVSFPRHQNRERPRETEQKKTSAVLTRRSRSAGGRSALRHYRSNGSRPHFSATALKVSIATPIKGFGNG